MGNKKPFGGAIRRGGLSDVWAIVALEKKCFDADAWSADDFTDTLADPDNFVLMAEDGGAEPAGYVLAHQGDRLGEIFSLAVDPARQGQGIGRTLLDQACTEMEDGGVININLEVRTNNESAIHLYETSGFVKAGTIKKYYADGADALRMVRRKKAAPRPRRP